MLVIRLRTVIIYFLILVLVFSVVHHGVLHYDSLPVQAVMDENSVVVPILMYHGITENQKKVGKFVISKEMFEKDLQYIKKEGYQTVTIDDVIRFVKNGEALPQRPIVITFDDGYYNNYCYAYPLLEEYEMKAVISPIGKYIDVYSENQDKNPAYAHFTWDEMKEMMDSGLVEIQNHSYDLHHNTGGRTGAKKKNGETQEAYSKFLENDLMIFQEKMRKNIGYTPTTFTYPYGGISDASFEILDKLGFQATLSCEEKPNIITIGKEECLQKLNRYLRSDKVSAEDILQKVLKELQ